MLAKRIQWNPAAWFVIAAAVLVGIGALASTVLGMGDSALDIPIHDTYFVVAHHHLVLATALFCLGCAVIYWAFSRILRRPLNRVLGLLHAVLTCVGLLSIYFPVCMISATTAPRRYYEYTDFEPMESSGSIVNIDLVVKCLAGSFILGQMVLLVNVIRTLVRRPDA